MKKALYWIWNCRNRIVLAIVSGLMVLLFIDWHVGQVSAGNVFFDLAVVPEKKIALVLGTAKFIQRGRLNLFYMPRIQASAELFKAGKVRGIVVSGDNGRTDYDEPNQMKRDLIALGIPEHYITCDYAGFSTYDSIQRVERVFQESSYIVVSQGFHVQRALYIAMDRGHDAAGFAVSSPGGYEGVKIRLREILARAKAFLDVNIRRPDPKFLGPLESVNKK